MKLGSRFDRCNWFGCHADCVDEIELCSYHFAIIGEAYIEHRSAFGSKALIARREAREVEREAERAEAQSVEDWWRSRSVVYYVRLQDHVKIGYTIHLRERVNQLRVDGDSLLAVEPGWRDVEADRHKTFAAERIGRRENFNPSRRLLAHIDLARGKYGEPWAFTARRVAAAGGEPTGARRTA